MNNTINTLLSLIISLRQNDFRNDITYILSNYFIKNALTIDNKSIKQISEECNVSTTSIINFVKLLGYNTYIEFKEYFMFSTKYRKSQYKDRIRNITLDDIFDKIDALTKEKINREDYTKKIEFIVEEIHKYKKVNFYGAVFPLASIQSFMEDMIMMGVTPYVNQKIYGNKSIKVYHESVHIVITNSGSYIELHRNNYNELISSNNTTILISQKSRQIGKPTKNMVIPKCISSEYSELVIQLIMFAISYMYSKKVL